MGVTMTIDNAVVTVEGGGVYLYGVSLAPSSSAREPLCWVPALSFIADPFNLRPQLGSRHLEATWSVRPGTHFAAPAILLTESGEVSEDDTNMLVVTKVPRAWNRALCHGFVVGVEALFARRRFAIYVDSVISGRGRDRALRLARRRGRRTRLIMDGEDRAAGGRAASSAGQFAGAKRTHHPARESTFCLTPPCF